jgi:hypothetical protein
MIVSKKRKKVCLSCGSRRALHFAGGRFRWDRMHPLCMRCFRSLRDRQRASALARRAIHAIERCADEKAA